MAALPLSIGGAFVMLPIALGLGLDTAFRAPMAIAVMGGLIFSTALSLVFVAVRVRFVPSVGGGDGK